MFRSQCNVPPLPEGRRYQAVAAGLYHTVLLRDDGQAVAFGDNDLEGQPRCDPSDTPVPDTLLYE